MLMFYRLIKLIKERRYQTSAKAEKSSTGM